jgi:hypothetical protein
VTLVLVLLSRGGLFVASVAACATLSACDGSDTPTPKPSTSSTQVTTSVTSLPSYCEIQGLRQMIADGEIKRSQLPDFADMTEVDGTPLILDFKKRSPEGTASFVGRLFASPGLKGVRNDPTEVTKCTETTTDADVERTQGGPGYLAGK